MAANDTTSASPSSLSGGDPSEALFNLAMDPSFILVLFELLFYGAYTMLFGVYIYLQVQQRGRQRFYQISLLLLYLLATGAMITGILSTKQLFFYFISILLTGSATDRTSTRHLDLYVDIEVAGAALYVVANIIADFLVLYRCYVVWGKRKLVIAVPFVVSIINTVIAFVALSLEKQGARGVISSGGSENALDHAATAISYAFLGINLFTNLILTAMIAGRIWWITNTTNKLLGSDRESDKRLGGIIAMVLESGLLYPIALIICIALQAVDTVAELKPMLSQIVIAPTLIMVRADLGISVENNSQPEPETRLTPDVEAFGGRTTLGKPDPYPYAYEPNGYNDRKDPYASHVRQHSGIPASAGKFAQRLSALDVTESNATRYEMQPLSAVEELPPPAFHQPSGSSSSSTIISSGPPARHDEKSRTTILSAPE